MLMHIFYILCYILMCFLEQWEEFFYIGLKFYNTESTSRYDKQAQGESSHNQLPLSILLIVLHSPIFSCNPEVS
jgi:hypothetical protein